MTDDTTLKLITAWEQFKQVNDARLREIDRKGHADPLFDEHLHNINTAIDAHATQARMTDGAVRGRPDHDGYGKAFHNYLRKGMGAGLEALQEQVLSAGSDPDGGYPVTPAVSDRIAREVFETSPLRRLAAVETISSDSLDLLDDSNQPAACWTTESSAVAETVAPAVAKWSIPTHELYAQPKAT